VLEHWAVSKSKKEVTSDADRLLLIFRNGHNNYNGLWRSDHYNRTSIRKFYKLGVREIWPLFFQISSANRSTLAYCRSPPRWHDISHAHTLSSTLYIYSGLQLLPAALISRGVSLRPAKRTLSGLQPSGAVTGINLRHASIMP